MTATLDDVKRHIDTQSRPGHWIWTGRTNYGSDKGAPKYGREYVRDIVWSAYHDTPHSQVVLHKCGVDRCVAPHHLSLGNSIIPKPEGDALVVSQLELINEKLDMIIKHLKIDPFGE